MTTNSAAHMGSNNSDWLEQDSVEADTGNVMYVDVDGYEGPLDLLLDLARKQKVDLANVSVLALAEQYLNFIETVRERRIEIAADYLVMAAWLAYLKSRLMVPQAPSDEEPSGEMMAAMLQFRLKRLEAMRRAGELLVNLPRLGERVFARGMPDTIVIQRSQLWEASLYDLLKAYAVQRERGVNTDYVPVKRKVMALQEAREILQRLIGEAMDWVPMDAFLSEYLASPQERVSVLASSFSASLELVREGHMELRQAEVFGPLLLRKSRREAVTGQEGDE